MGTFRTTVGIENMARRGAVVSVDEVVVDTGADATWIPRAILESLAVTPEHGRTTVLSASQEVTMRKRPKRVSERSAEYYDRRGVLGELEEQPVEFALDEELRRQIVRGERTRRLQNISIKLDPVQIQALRKIATIKSIPYQTLIRQWLAEAVRRELKMAK